MEQLNNHETQESIPDRGAISELVDAAKAEGCKVAEVGVWENGSVNVPDGEVGMIPTEALNGCHVSIITADLPNGEKSVSMTHFPPDIGARGYIESLEKIQAAISAQGGKANVIVTLVASDRLPREITVLKELFPDITPHSLSYVSRDKARRSSPDAGRCVAILDRRDPSSQTLHVATDSGDVLLSA